MPRRSRGPREPVHSIIGRDATSTRTHKIHKKETTLTAKIQQIHHRFVKPPVSPLHLFEMEEEKRRAAHKAESKTAASISTQLNWMAN